MLIQMNFAVMGLIMIFAAIFVAGKMAKLNSPVIDAFAWILGIVLFVVVLLSKIAPLFHW
jgi:hypothetical protein